MQNIRRVDLALVLDVTGSMNSNGKLSQLKDAAVELVDILMPQNKPLLNRIALAPYSAAVNLGPDIAATASNSASTDGCVVERDGDNASTEAPPADGSYFTVESQLTIPPADNHYACPPATLLPLTNNAGLLRGTINSYGADGWTAGHIGLAWGWYLLSPEWNGVWPAASAGRPYDPAHTVKAVILMTDGEFNTSYLNGTVNESSDEQTLALCEAMKADGKDIILFTVAFQAPAEAEALLRSCATSDDHYFDANDGPALTAAFQDIANRLSSLRLTQ